MNARLVFTTAALPAEQARAIVAIICSDTSTTSDRTRMRMQNRLENSLVRVINFAKHETLRKAHRHLHSHRAIMGADQPEHPDAKRIVFNPEELKHDLEVMLSTELPITLNAAASDTLASVGFRDPWKLPAQATLDFIARRLNLLSGVSNEIFDKIRAEISASVIAGEPIRDLSARITAAFSEIEKTRATLIAETETRAAYSFAGHMAAVAAGIKYKKWVHSVIPKVPRPDHLAIDGLIVPIDQPYPVGNPPLMYPHDGNGSAEDVINCRCLSNPILDSQYEAYKAQQNANS